MDVEAFRTYGKEMVDRICENHKSLSSQDVYPDVKPGYLQDLLPSEAPEEPEAWPTIMTETKEHIMRGITQWQHPQFFGYFPQGASFSSLMGEMMSDSIGAMPYSWSASPACNELEVIVLDWLCKALNLPKHFLSKCKGGGTIQSSSTECIFNCILAARAYGIAKTRGGDCRSPDCQFLPKLVAYCSEESHICVEKSMKLALLNLRILRTDEKCILRGETVRRAIEEDMARGLTPIFLTCTLGSASSTAVDRFDEIGPLCKKYDIWFHVDGSYGGLALICPELKRYARGIEYADSFHTNADDWLLVHSDCSCLWVKNREKYCSTFIVDPLHLECGKKNDIQDFKNWGISFSRKFRSLKLWYTIRTYGLKGLREYQRNHMKLAKYFEDLIGSDCNFEVMNNVLFGLVCFRLKNSNNKSNQVLLSRLNESRKIHMIPAELKGDYVLRFCVTAQYANEADIDTAFQLIQKEALTIVEEDQDEKCTCPRSRKFAFTKDIPKEIYNMNRSLHLKDIPILTPKEKMS